MPVISYFFCNAFQGLTMIKILRAEVVTDKVVRLTFSDGGTGDYDLTDLLSLDTEMVRPLREPEFFADFFWNSVPCVGVAALS